MDSAKAPKIDTMAVAYILCCAAIVMVYTNHIKKQEKDAAKLNADILKAFQDKLANEASKN